MQVDGQSATRAGIFKRKRSKNLALLAVIMAWVALIFFITIAKIAHSAEPPSLQPDFKAHDPYTAGEAAHTAEMIADRQKFDADAAQHAESMKGKQQSWWQDWSSRHGL